MTAQRTLAIRIAAITLASDSAKTLARFRPSKGLPFPELPKQSVKHKGTQGVPARVRRGTSSAHFQCLAPQSSSHVGCRIFPSKIGKRES